MAAIFGQFPANFIFSGALNMSVLEPFLFTYFYEWRRPLHIGITYHNTFLVATRRGKLLKYLSGILESVSPEFAPSHSNIECCM